MSHPARASDQSLAAAARLETEERLRILFDHAPYGVFVVDLEGRYLTVNETYARQLGYSVEDLLPLSLELVTHPADREFYAERCRQLASGEIPSLDLEKRSVRKDGSIVWVEVHASLTRDESGRPRSTVGLVFDASERKRAEAALRASEERFRQIFENGMIAVAFFDLTGKFTDANDAFLEIVGYPREDLEAGRVSLRRITPGDEQPRLSEAMAELVATGKLRPIAKVCVRNDDKRIPTLLGAALLASGTGAVAFVLDMTEQKRAGEKLRETESLLEKAQELGQIGAYSSGLDDDTLVWSRGAYRIFGVEPGTPVTTDTFFEHVHPEDREPVRAAVREAVATGGPYRVTHRAIRADGETRWVVETGEVERAEAGEPLRLVGVCQDVTERKRNEDALAEAARRKDEFLAMLGHELRNPLAPIRSAVEILKLRGPALPDVTRARDVIDRQARHLTRLVDDLLEVSRITRGKIRLEKRRTDAASIVARSVELTRPFLEARRSNLAILLPDAPIELEVDPTRMAQVLGNLLHNAAKYGEEGGPIELSVGRDGDAAVFRVKDAGVGIAPDMLEKVFDLFTQAERSLDRSQGGLGIGLTLARTIVELHGGTVRARSDGPGQGSELVVQLPAVRPETETRCALPVEACRASSRRILLVEDNPDAALLLADLLGLEGHEVRTAPDGFEALEILDVFRPEVVLLDIGLPGIDGYEVARRIRQRPQLEAVRIVAVTGYGQEEDRRRSRQAGIDHHLVKPLDLEALEALLR